jgi:hypothetical protein
LHYCRECAIAAAPVFAVGAKLAHEALLADKEAREKNLEKLAAVKDQSSALYEDAERIASGHKKLIDEEIREEKSLSNRFEDQEQTLKGISDSRTAALAELDRGAANLDKRLKEFEKIAESFGK